MTGKFLTMIAALLPLAAPAASQQPPAYDIVIRNARVLDGGGNPWVHADVAVKDGGIARIGTVPGKGAREIDATGAARRERTHRGSSEGGAPD